MVSPLILPLYLVVTWFPFISRTTLKETPSPVLVPSSISVTRTSPSRPGAPSLPVTLSPSDFSFRVILRSGPPLRPGMVQVQVPEGSAFLSSAFVCERKPSAKVPHRALIINDLGICCLNCIRHLIFCFVSLPVPETHLYSDLGTTANHGRGGRAKGYAT